MKFNKYIKTAMLVLLCSGIFTTSVMCIDKVNAAAQTVTKPAAQQVQQQEFINVKPLTVVNLPKEYLNKKIVMNAKFDKFSTLGLDYKPAFKSSEDYISFLIKRDDTNFDIPLSEMKLFLKRSTAEKFIELKTNDELEIKGTVFSDALGDAWVDVCELKIIKKAPSENE